MRFNKLELNMTIFMRRGANQWPTEAVTQEDLDRDPDAREGLATPIRENRDHAYGCPGR